jgi:hypothetical protein
MDVCDQVQQFPYALPNLLTGHLAIDHQWLADHSPDAYARIGRTIASERHQPLGLDTTVLLSPRRPGRLTRARARRMRVAS